VKSFEEKAYQLWVSSSGSISKSSYPRLNASIHEGMKRQEKAAATVRI
jgi:hypothetical protein